MSDVASTQKPGTKRLRAVVVDDEAPLRTMLVRVIEELGLDVDEAADGRAALTLLETGPAPDLFVVDFSMPFMRGDELLRIVAERFPGAGAVLMSGHGEHAIRARLGTLAARTALLPKPFNLDELVGAIERALHRS
jgi:two-component system, cell cycle sensor histidine kinase and response regulator CckA